MIRFDDSTHTYTLDNNPLISVTQLMQRYKLSTSYAEVPQDVLEKAATRGNAVHKALEEHIKGDPNMITLFDEVRLFEDYMQRRQVDRTTIQSERIVYDPHYMIAGTVDLEYDDGDEHIIADFKTTYTLHIDAVAWQLSLYNYLITKGDIIAYYFNNLKVFHLRNNRLAVKDVYTVEYDAVQSLLEAHYNGELEYVYVKPNNIISKTEEGLIEQLLHEKNVTKQHLAKLDKELDILLNKAKKELLAAKDYSYKTSTLSLTYIAPQQRAYLNKKKVEAFIEKHGEDPQDFYTNSTVGDRVQAKLQQPKEAEDSDSSAS